MHGFIVGASSLYTNEQRRSLFHLQVLGKFPCFNFQIATTGTGLEIRINMISMLAVICGLQGCNLNTEICCICWNHHPKPTNRGTRKIMKAVGFFFLWTWIVFVKVILVGFKFFFLFGNILKY